MTTVRSTCRPGKAETPSVREKKPISLPNRNQFHDAACEAFVSLSLARHSGDSKGVVDAQRALTRCGWSVIPILPRKPRPASEVGR